MKNFYLNWDFSWLNLGNVFSESIYLIQWYEYTGVFGGTLWILIVNFLIFNFIVKKENFYNRKEIVLKALTIVFLVITPIYIHPYIQIKYKTENEINVAIFQPNIDPYEKKYKKSKRRAF